MHAPTHIIPQMPKKTRAARGAIKKTEAQDAKDKGDTEAELAIKNAPWSLKNMGNNTLAAAGACILFTHLMVLYLMPTPFAEPASL
jgi:hypothetical protein